MSDKALPPSVRAAKMANHLSNNKKQRLFAVSKKYVTEEELAALSKNVGGKCSRV